MDGMGYVPTLQPSPKVGTELFEGDGIIQPEELDFDAVQRLLKELLVMGNS